MSFTTRIRTCVTWLLVIATGVATTPLLSAPSVAQAAAVLPALPNVYLNTAYAPPSGRTIFVPAGGDFQGALNAAQPGEVISLQAGATFTGPFTLPNKPGAGWIYVRTSAPDSTLPPPGTRIDPSYASLMPKIVVGGAQWNYVIQSASGAHHYRFVGVEIAPTPGTYLFTLIELGNPSSNIIFDRSYIHGDPVVGSRWGIDLGGASEAVVDSYISAMTSTSDPDTHGISVWDSPGPIKIVNNYIAASGENINFGGQDPDVQNLVPSDIEIRGNYLVKPLSWYVHSSTYAGTHWGVKNLFEMKNARRALIDGNILENIWADQQDGFAIQLTPRNQSGGCPWCVIADITFTHNIVRHIRAGVHIIGTDNNQPSQPAQRILIQNNLFLDVGAFPDVAGSCCPPGLLFLMDNGTSQNVTIDHNTAFQSDLEFEVNDPQAGLVITNNLSGAGVSGGFTGWVFTNNVVYGGLASSYPAGNFFPAPGVPLINAFYGGSDFSLVPGSPYANAGTDGKALGADIGTLNTRTANVMAGAPTTATAAPATAPAPVAGPVTAPVAAPVTAPVAAPVTAPVAAPVTAPVAAPVTAPTRLTTLPPSLALTASSPNFGRVVVGGSVYRSFTVTNTGGGALRGTASSGAPFSVSSGGSFNLPPGASQIVVVRFTPTGTGVFNGSVSFASNGGSVSQAVTGRSVRRVH